MSTNAERKFVNLRKRLDQLGYRQPLGIETLPLVEKLFSDLVHTTESLRNAKLSAGKFEKESRNVDALLEPYKTENGRLVRENNELHLGLLKLGEDKDRISRDLKAYIRKLDHETSDLKFLNNQYVHKVRALEKDSKAKTERILLLQEKNMQAVVQTPGGKKRPIPFRRQRMQIDELLPSSQGPVPPVVAQPDDPYVADLLRVADDRIQELQQEVTGLKLDLERAQNGIQHLNTQVEERDKEIERLNRALDGGRPHDVISLEAQNRSNEALIAQLGLQVELLQEAKCALEQQLEAVQQQKQGVCGEVAELSERNQQLCQELSHIDQLALRLEQRRDAALGTADQQLQQAQRELQLQQSEKEEMAGVVSSLKQDLAERELEGSRLRDQMDDVQEQNAKMEGLINFLEEEKRRLQDKMEKMTQADKELVVELERLREQHGVCRSDRSPSRLDSFIRSLEEERDHFRQQAELYRKARGGVDRSPTHSPIRGRSPRGQGGRHGRVDSADRELLSHAVRERDELQGALLGLERHMEDIQTRVRLLTAERDQLRTERDQISSQCTQIQDELQRVHEERNGAELEIQKLKMEANAVAQPSAVSEQVEQRVLELESALHTLQQEKAELSAQVCVLKESRVAVEEELKVQAEENTQHRAQGSTLRLLQEQMEGSVCELQRRLVVKSSELQAAEQQILSLQDATEELRQRVITQEEEVCVLQRAVASLDREKDVLQEAVDQKAERLLELQHQLDTKENTLSEVRLSVAEMEKSLDQLKGALSSRDREVASLRRQLDSAQQDLASLSKDGEITRRENRRLQDDLATMTRENQAVHGEMEQALCERDELKLRVHSYISDVARIEKLMEAKEQESRDLLERFRVSHREVAEQQERLQHSEGLASSLRLELLSSDTERRHLRTTLSQLQAEGHERVSALQAYEEQVSSLARTMATLEHQLQAEQAEKAAVLADLGSVRELCVKLDTSKEFTARQLTAKSMELERVLGELEDVRSETELVRKQLANERATVGNLEELLSTNRQKEFQTHLSASERETELKVLRDRLALADSKTAAHAKEVAQLRGKVFQLQTEMDVLKRQLTSERFERERAVQEMRRQGVSFSSLRSPSPLSASVSPRPHSLEHSVLQTPERSPEKPPEKNVSFKE